MSVSTVRGPFGTLRFEQDIEWVRTDLPEPDPDWHSTDSHGHEHYYDKDARPEAGHYWPTLAWVVDDTWWCEDCQDEHEEGHWACAICEEVIEPGMRPPPTHAIPMIRAQQYFLNDEPISLEQAEALIAEISQA